MQQFFTGVGVSGINFFAGDNDTSKKFASFKNTFKRCHLHQQITIRRCKGHRQKIFATVQDTDKKFHLCQRNNHECFGRVIDTGKKILPKLLKKKLPWSLKSLTKNVASVIHTIEDEKSASGGFCRYR